MPLKAFSSIIVSLHIYLKHSPFPCAVPRGRCMVYGWGSVPWDGGDPANFYPLGAPDNHTPKILYISKFSV